MNCKSFPQCNFECGKCPEYVPNKAPVIDEELDTLLSQEADDWLSSIEAHELKYLF